MSNKSTIPDNIKGYLILHTGGDEPFIVTTGEAAYSYLSTQEYYAVNLDTLQRIDEDGNTHDLDVVDPDAPDIEAEDCQFGCVDSLEEMGWDKEQKCWVCGVCNRPQ